MKKATRYLLYPALASLLVWSAGSTGLAVDRSGLDVPKQLHGLALTSQVAGHSWAPVLIATQRGQATAVARQVERLGGEVVRLLPGSDFVVARLPVAAMTQLEKSQAVRALAVDRPVRLDPAAMQPLKEQAATIPSASDPALSLKITRGEIRAPQFAQQTAGDGTGTVIAILDTGVDPAHPALLKTSKGEPKIIDWQDFTGEGDVATVETRSGSVSGIPSQSGVYHVGQFKESQIPTGEMNSDINRNGKSDDTFAILVADSRQKGVYDTVYVDTNANGNFADEKPLGAYSQTHEAAIFGSADVKDGVQQGVNFVVSRINADGSGINLGYDGGEHGTHVAGITAGTGPMTGVAPGAQIMAIKVLTSGGSGAWGGIIQGMEYAASHGAQVINMSLGGLADLNDGGDPQSLLVKQLSDKYGVLFSIAAGNSGPGLNTMGLPGVAGAAVTSGAFISTNTWKADYGLTVPQDGLWYFSSAGPRDDGGLKPNIVAPGTANSAIPTWAGQYAVFQGTSMATPQTTGAAALLIGEANQTGLTVKPNQVIQALELGARRLPGYAWFEQGHGLIQVDQAWNRLQQIAKESNPDLVSFGRAKSGTNATGLYARDFTATADDAKWALGNRDFLAAKLDLSYLPGNGLTLSGPAAINLPGLQRRMIDLKFDRSAQPGVYDALVQARKPGQTSYAAEYLATVVVPYTFDPAKQNVISGIKGALGPARYGRHFVQVPAGTAELTINLTVPDQKGRVRLMAYTPDGMPYGTGTAWAGAPEGPDGQPLQVENPTPGVWEIDAYASHGSMNYGLAVNQYSIEMAARGVYASPAKVALAPLFGSKQTRNVTFSNYYGDIQAAVAGVGFVQPKSERLEVERGNVVDKFFEVTEGTALLRASFSGLEDPTADLDIGLYYNDPKLGGWVAVGQVSGTRFGREVQLLSPAPGQYAVEVVGKQMVGVRTGFTYSLTQVQGGDQGIKPRAGQAAARKVGERWTVPVDVTLPAQPGAYVGVVTLTDVNTGKVLSVVPAEIR
jgi:tripeptidyl-peptidase II